MTKDKVLITLVAEVEIGLESECCNCEHCDEGQCVVADHTIDNCAVIYRIDVDGYNGAKIVKVEVQ